MGEWMVYAGGALRVSIISFASIAVVQGKKFPFYDISLYLCIALEAIFLVLSCVGLSDNAIEKIIDKVIQVVLAVMLLCSSNILLYYSIQDALAFGMKKFIWEIAGGFAAFIAGCMCASFAVMLWNAE